MVKIFGRKTPLELSFIQVEKYNFRYIYKSHQSLPIDRCAKFLKMAKKLVK